MNYAFQLVQQNLSYILFVLLVALASFCVGLLRTRAPRVEATAGGHSYSLAPNTLGLSHLYTMGFAHGQVAARGVLVSAPVLGDLIKALEASAKKLEGWLGADFPKALFEAEKLAIAGVVETLEHVMGQPGFAKAREALLKQTDPKALLDLLKVLLAKLKEAGS